MPDEPSSESAPKSRLGPGFFAWLSEQPERRGGGRIVSVREVAELRSQLREGVPQPARPSRSREMEKRRHQLALMAHQLEIEARG